MTMQILDKLLYEAEEYEMVDWSAPLGFHPCDYGMNPVGTNTANHRGFYCEWEIADGKLKLERMYVNDSDNNYPPINGDHAMNSAPPPFWGYHGYFNIDLDMSYTGVMAIGRIGRNSPFHIGGIRKRSSFAKVLEITFEDGWLKSVRDVSVKNFEEYTRQIEDECNQWADAIAAAAAEFSEEG